LIHGIAKAGKYYPAKSVPGEDHCCPAVVSMQPDIVADVVADIGCPLINIYRRCGGTKNFVL